MEYLVVIHPAMEGGYWADVPALDGCYAQAETIEDLLSEARSAIQSHVEALRAEGRPIPSGDGIVVATVQVTPPAAA